MKKLLTAVIILLLFPINLAGMGVECPVPEEDRVVNGTGIQCVWSSLETIARYIGEERLYTLTDRYKRQAGPGDVASVLGEAGVPYEQSTNKTESRMLIMRGMARGMPVLLGWGGYHAMVIANYDPTCNRVSIIDNSNLGAGIKDMTISEFENGWDGWVVLLHPGVRPKKSIGARVHMLYLE